jgi:hypothetical protein
MAHAEKGQHVGVNLGRALAKVLGTENEQPLAREVSEPALELVGVEAAREVGVVAVVG